MLLFVDLLRPALDGLADIIFVVRLEVQVGHAQLARRNLDCESIFSLRSSSLPVIVRGVL